MLRLIMMMKYILWHKLFHVGVWLLTIFTQLLQPSSLQWGPSCGWVYCRCYYHQTAYCYLEVLAIGAPTISYPPPFFMLIYHLPTSWLCTSKCLSRPSTYYCFIGNTFDNIISFYVYSICSITDAGVPHGLAFASFNEEVLVSISGHDNDDNNNNDDWLQW